MASERALAASLAALFASSAAAQLDQLPVRAEPFPVVEPPAPEPPKTTPLSAGGQLWRFSLGLEGAVAFDTTSTAVVGTASASFYLTPLVDHAELPLGLLTFIEHPDTAGASLGNTVDGVAATIGASMYPWGDTGVAASLGGEDDPKLGQGRIGGDLLMQKYFGRNIHGALGYAGWRFWQSAQYTSYDGARAALSVLLGPVLLSTQVDVAVEQSELQGTAAEFVPPTGSFFRSASLSASLYLGRRWTVSVFGSAALLTYNDTGGSAATEAFGVSGEVYLTESLYLIAGIQPVFHQFKNSSPNPGDNFAQTASTLQTLWVQVSYRL